jgi:hypothetical protein
MKLGMKIGCQRCGISGTERQHEIDILRCPWNAPGRDGKPADQSILLDQMPGLRVVETTHDLG